ncbi:DUF3307 domain-containing protein [Bizionia paragorgiae]|jgi:hypothetical protein|uniref:DUF3307 domain-containing protein n=1 Tax=Bizionia paragorgiae TaxID=283786 RepID=UPI00299E56FB|nr:DUF3307 domain-containing protein [Bizionia paragorgiae]MDX1270504.1 DUF3307 domain-containing protein [Bizionia paragorgiae]
MLFFFLILVLAHCLGDFVFQPTKWVKHKRKKKYKSKYVYYHILIHFLALTLVLQADFRSYWLAFLIIIPTHYAIDLVKLQLQTKKNARVLFAADQIAHLIVLAVVTAIYYPSEFSIAALITPQLIVFITFLLIATVVASVCMKVIISKWSLEDTEGKKSGSLEQAGAYIGVLERLFVFVFIITGHWEGVGFLMAAKSIFRFGDLSKAKDRKLTEYVLIGTLMSFGFAILAGLGFIYFNSAI